MTDLLEIVLAARDKNKGWVVPLIVFAVYIISGILKSRSRNKAEKEQKQAFGQDVKRRYKPIEGTTQQPAKPSPTPTARRAQKLPYARPSVSVRAEQPRPKPETRQADEPPDRSFTPPQPVAQRPRPVLRTRSETPRPKPVTREPKRIQRREVKPPKKEAPVKPAAAAEERYTGGFENLLANLQDKDSLKRAIIYSEILGKPLSLRDM